jgi:hypothetical protein
MIARHSLHSPALQHLTPLESALTNHPSRNPFTTITYKRLPQLFILKHLHPRQNQHLGDPSHLTPLYSALTKNTGEGETPIRNWLLLSIVLESARSER